MGFFSKSESERSAELTGYRSDGIKDGVSGRTDPPHTIGVLDHLLLRDNFIEELQKDNQAYADGNAIGTAVRSSRE